MFAFLVILVALNVFAASNPPQPMTVTTPKGTSYNPPVELTDFTMMSSTGSPVSLSDFAGSYTLLFFGYTHCPDVCPTTLLTLGQVKEALGASAAEMHFVFISVDSPRDTLEVLKDYVENYDPEFIALSGDDETLNQISPDFGLYYKRPQTTSSFYLVEHTARLFLIDPQGHLVMSFAYGTPTDVIVDALQARLETS